MTIAMRYAWIGKPIPPEWEHDALERDDAGQTVPMLYADS